MGWENLKFSVGCEKRKSKRIESAYFEPLIFLSEYSFDPDSNFVFLSCPLSQLNRVGL